MAHLKNRWQITIIFNCKWQIGFHFIHLDVEYDKVGVLQNIRCNNNYEYSKTSNYNISKILAIELQTLGKHFKHSVLLKCAFFQLVLLE